MKKLLTFIILGFFNVSIASSVISCNSQSTSQINLNNLILTKDLGIINMTGTIPNKKELLQGIKDNNINANVLTESDFSLKDIPTETSETIIGMGNYSGEVTVEYNKNTQTINLDSIITVTNLKTISTEGQELNKQELLDAIIANNATANKLKLNDFGFNDNPTPTSVTITGIGKYRGEVTLNYLLN